MGEIIERKSEELTKRFKIQLNEIVRHIDEKTDFVSPVFVGAAVSSAESYYLNFIVRLLENSDKGFSYLNESSTQIEFPKDFVIKIIIPDSVNGMTRSDIIRYYNYHGFDEFVIHQAGARELFFYGKYNKLEKKLVIVDIPTSITASYSVVSSVLNMDSDDEYDDFAEERFVAKEMDIYSYTLQKLLASETAGERLLFINDETKRNMIIENLKNVSVEIENIKV